MRAWAACAIALVVAACASFGSDASDAGATADAGADGPGPAADAEPDAGGDAPFADASGSAYAAEVLADKPLLYFRLGEPNGTRATDSSGHGTDGAYLGAVTQGLPGAIANDPDTAVRFGIDAGDSEQVRVVPSFDFAGLAQFTLEAWVKPETDGDGAFSGIVGRGPWALATQYDVGTVKFTRADSDGGWDGPWYTTKLPRDHFTHVVGTYDGATMRLYIDGLDVGAQAATRVIPASTAAVLIGPHFPGILDEVAVYDHPLGADRVRAHHNAGVGN
jgi:hypothetical protein